MLTKHLMFLVMGKRQTVESTTMEAVRDGLIEVFPWAHNATVGDDYVWPEVGQQQKSTSKREAALRIVRIESVLRLALAAKHGEERLVRHLSARDEEVAEREDADVASRVIRDVANTPADAGAVQIKFGAAVMEAHGAMIAATNALTGDADYEEMRRKKMAKTLVMKLARKLRNAVAEEEERRLPAGVLSRASEVSDARRGCVAVVGQTASVTIKQLPGAHVMTVRLLYLAPGAISVNAPSSKREDETSPKSLKSFVQTVVHIPMEPIPCLPAGLDMAALLSMLAAASATPSVPANALLMCMHGATRKLSNATGRRVMVHYV